MTDRNDSMTAIQVEVFCTFIIPYMATFSFYDINIEKRIYIE